MTEILYLDIQINNTIRPCPSRHPRLGRDDLPISPTLVNFSLLFYKKHHKISSVVEERYDVETMLENSLEWQKAQKGELYRAFVPELVSVRNECYAACNAFNDSRDQSRRNLVKLWRK